MSLGDIEKGTAGIKKQAKELIEQAYLRGYKEGYLKAETACYTKTADDRQASYERGLKLAWDTAVKICCCGRGCFSASELEAIFGTVCDSDILLYNAASVAIAKIQEYEAQKREAEKKKKESDKSKAEYLASFCSNRSCFKCVLSPAEFKCGLGRSWRDNPEECGDIDKAYELVTEYQNNHQADTGQSATHDLAVGDEVTFTSTDNKELTGIVTGFCPDTNEFRILLAEGNERYVFSATKTGRHFSEMEEVLKKLRGE